MDVHRLDLLFNDFSDAPRLGPLHAPLSVECLRQRRFANELLHDRFAVPWQDKPVTGPDVGHLLGLFAKERRLEGPGLKHREQ